MDNKLTRLHRPFLLLLLMLSLLSVGLAVQSPVAAHANYPIGHDNTTASSHDYAWTHGDPNTGLIPGNGNAANSYYYLKIYAAGPTVFCEVYSGGAWLIELEDVNKNVLASTTTTNTGARVYITNGVTGNLYQCRIANIGTVPQKDYAELNSGAVGDTYTSDCGGPGPVWDPNFNEAPMEPVLTPGMPVNGCDNPTTVTYSTGDPRLSPPPDQHNYDLGPVQSQTYTVTTTRTGDLTAFAFVGSQGTNATINITDSHGVTVNGLKWGDMDPNPKTMNQEWADADAGVQPPGTYQIHYTGPTQLNHDMWAISGEA